MRNGEKENHYTILRNAMGDVAGLLTPDGTLIGTYEYDPYGKLISLTHNSAYADTDGILERNPFRYRGYYYDAETGWYYLQSRYYDPEVKRFINADTPDLLTNECINLMQYNLFMYCNGDPVNEEDMSGHGAIMDIYMAIMCLQSLITGNPLTTTNEANGEPFMATSVGVSASITYGLAHAVSLQLYTDQYGEVALQFTYGNGVGGGEGFGLGGISAIYPQIKGIEETEDYGVAIGGSGGFMGKLGADLLFAEEGDDMHVIGGVLIGHVGESAEGHVIMSKTITIFRTNIFEHVNRINRFLRR